jgi:enoyl-CoA hydratase/carnithine racemase
MDYRTDLSGERRLLGDPMSAPPVRIEADGRVLRISLDRPEARNALDWESLEALSAAMVQLDTDDDLWIGVLTGTGDKTFCAGADLKKLPGEIAEQRAKGHSPPPTPLTGAWVKKPLVCALNGDALGGGLELALGCDVRVAADHVLLGLPEARWSLIPAGSGTWRLPREIGKSRAISMMMTGSSVPASTGVKWGLIHSMVPGRDLQIATDEIVASILACGPLAVREIKRLVHEGESRSLAEGIVAEQRAIEVLQTSGDVGEGLMSFIERRAPEWKGR